jgi:hypothetical protein
LVIQTAHDILIDPQQKAKYDATRGRAGASRYPTASGVKGNPYSHVSQQYPAPPRRNAAPKGTTSGAERWNTRFSSGVPPTAKATSDAEAMKNNAKAFENMRNKSQQSAKSGINRKPEPPPPVPPRTESARQRAEASFGNRKSSGYYPQSTANGDEPYATNSNYQSRGEPRVSQPSATSKTTSEPMPDPLSQFREEANVDPRQSSPYTSQGGEKLNPFEGAIPTRSKSTRESSSQHFQGAAAAAFAYGAASHINDKSREANGGGRDSSSTHENAQNTTGSNPRRASLGSDLNQSYADSPCKLWPSRVRNSNS